jgi:hypothetical protein
MKNQKEQTDRGTSQEPGGTSWQFKVLALVLAIGFLALIARAMGLV